MTQSSGPSPILEAVYRGDDSRLRELLRADPGLLRGVTPDGWTPLHLAAFFGRADAVDVLLAAGADVRAVSRNHEGNMPLHAALAGRGVGRITTMLLAHGADVRAPDAGGTRRSTTPAFRDDVGLVNTILAHGVDPGTKNHAGKTALTIAEEHGNAAVARPLRGELP